MKRRDGALVRCHEHPACALGELMQIGKTPASAHPVLPHPPEPFDGIEMVAAMSRQDMSPHFSLVVVEGCVELVRPMDPARSTTSTTSGAVLLTVAITWWI